MRRSRLGKAAWNERIKLVATTCNGVGLTLLALGVLGPWLGAGRPLGLQAAVCFAIFAVLHATALKVVRWMED